VEGLTNLLNKSSGEVASIRDRFNSIQDGLKGVTRFSDFKANSFNDLMSMLNDRTTNQLFARAQNAMKWMDRLDKWTGGALTKSVTKLGEKFISRIGNQAVKDFMQNSLKTLAEKGFQQGLQAVLKGVAGGLTKAGLGAAGPPGWIIAAALAAKKVLDFIKDKVGKLLEKLGLDIGIKNALQENLGKFFGGAVNMLISGAMLILALPLLIGGIVLMPIIFGVLIFLFVSQMFTNNLISSRPPSTQMAQQVPSQDYIIPEMAAGSIVLPQITVGQVSRQDAINMAMALKGKVRYPQEGARSWWSQLPPNAINPKWASGAEGLDCIGFVRWVYFQLTGGKFTGYIRDGAQGIYPNAKANVNKDPYNYYFIDKSELKPGDMVLGKLKPEHNYNPGHIGLYLGKDPQGRNLYIHTTTPKTPVWVCSDEYRYVDPDTGHSNGMCQWGFYVRPGKRLIDFTDD
jgi:hypothetical protein